MIQRMMASICCGHDESTIFRWARPSNIVLSSLPMWVAPLVRVSKLAAVASIVRSSPWPSHSQPSAAAIASRRSWWPTATRRITFQSKNGQKVLTQALKPWMA